MDLRTNVIFNFNFFSLVWLLNFLVESFFLLWLLLYLMLLLLLNDVVLNVSTPFFIHSNHSFININTIWRPTVRGNDQCPPHTRSTGLTTHTPSTLSLLCNIVSRATLLSNIFFCLVQLVFRVVERLL